MRTLRHCWVAANLLAGLLFPSIAVADTIRITSGTVELGGAFDLVGNDGGFRLSGRGYGGGASPAAYVFCAGTECNAGEVADLQHAFGGLDLNVNSATLNGITYDEVNTLGAEAFATIGFSSTHLLPAFSSTAVLTTPFMMQGSFSHSGGVETLVGTGLVTTRWLSAPGGSAAPAWNLESARYQFSDPAAVPEPGTLLLVVTGVAAAALSRRKSRFR